MLRRLDFGAAVVGPPSVLVGWSSVRQKSIEAGRERTSVSAVSLFGRGGLVKYCIHVCVMVAIVAAD